MKRTNTDLGFGVAIVFCCAWMAFSGTSSATLPIQKQAKAAGVDASNCLYCHGEKLPKKDAVTHNDRGNWLIKEKAKRGAKEVDGAWVKDYPGDKK